MAPESQLFRRLADALDTPRNDRHQAGLRVRRPEELQHPLAGPSEVPRAQNLAVVKLVARDDVCERADGYFRVVRHSTARPGLLVHVLELEDRGLAHNLELRG